MALSIFFWFACHEYALRGTEIKLLWGNGQLFPFLVQLLKQNNLCTIAMPEISQMYLPINVYIYSCPRALDWLCHFKNYNTNTIEYKMLHPLKEILCPQKVTIPQRLLPNLPLISVETKNSARILMSDLYNHLRMSKCRWLHSWRNYIEMVHWLSMTTGCWWAHLGQSDYSYLTDTGQNSMGYFRQIWRKAWMVAGKQIHFNYVFYI